MAFLLYNIHINIHMLNITCSITHLFLYHIVYMVMLHSVCVFYIFLSLYFSSVCVCVCLCTLRLLVQCDSLIRVLWLWWECCAPVSGVLCNRSLIILFKQLSLNFPAELSANRTDLLLNKTPFYIQRVTPVPH